jgi:hypothetical protein
LQHIVSAEVAQHVSQHGHGIVKVPVDVVQTLDGYFKGAGGFITSSSAAAAAAAMAAVVCN